MTCAACGSECEVEEHVFVEGLGYESWKLRYPGKPYRPKRMWVIFAPRYFRSNADHTACVEPYCSAKCALARMGR